MFWVNSRWCLLLTLLALLFAWNRVKSHSAESFTFDILKTQLLKPVINKGKPSWSSLSKTPIKLNLLAILDLTRFAKLSITSVMPITYPGPSGTSRQGTEIPMEKFAVTEGWHSLTWKTILMRFQMHCCVFYRFGTGSNNKTWTPVGFFHRDRTSGVNLPRKGRVLRFLHLSSMTLHTWFVLFSHL